MIPETSWNPCCRIVTLASLYILAIGSSQIAMARTPHPDGLHSKWLGKKTSELIDAYDEPDHRLETAVRGIVVYGDTPSVMYVYASNPEFGGGCIAAYVIELDTMEIIRFQCR